MRVSDLDRLHPDYAKLQQYWREIELLYAGGQAILDNASLFLRKRPMEPEGMYAERLKGFSYQGILSTAIGWYSSELFETEPLITCSPAKPEYVDAFLQNADRGGNSLWTMVSEWWERAVLDGSVWVLLDLPASPDAPVDNYAQQVASGLLDPFLVTFQANQVINWHYDAYGVLEWAVVRTQIPVATFGGPIQLTDRWYYYDREIFQIWEAAPAKPNEDASKREAQLIKQGPHAMAPMKRVPLRRFCIPPKFWLAYRVKPQLVDHINEDNGLRWGLFMGNVAMPVIKSDEDIDVKIGEAAYLRLGTNGDFFWAEPSGNTFETSSRRVDTLREEIYRQMYLQAQGRSSSATASAQSGWSKEVDMAPSKDVLKGFGALLRKTIREVLQDVVGIRRDNTEVEVQGLDFETSILDDIQAAQSALEVGIPSKTFEQQVCKRMARKYMGAADKAILQQIDTEIDQAPSRQERMSAMQDALRVNPTIPNSGGDQQPPSGA